MASSQAQPKSGTVDRDGTPGLDAARRGPRGQYSVGGRRRQQILQVAESLVLKVGHRSLTMKHIAFEVGVSEATVYHHFLSKDVLLLEVLQQRDERLSEIEFNDPIEWLVSSVPNSGSDFFMAEIYIHFAGKASDPEHPANAYFQMRHQRLSRFFAEAVQAQDSHMILPPEKSAQIFLALTDGLLARWVRERNSDIGDLIAELSDALNRCSQPPVLDDTDARQRRST